MQNRTTNQRQYWDSLAQTYSQRYHLNSQRGQAKIRRKADMLIAGAGISNKSDALEIGCGTGIFTKELAKTGDCITAMDISPQMVRVALDNYSPDVFYMLGDIHKTVFHDNRFDTIVGCYILQYLDLNIALPEIYRILKPGGRFAFIEINALNPIAFAKTKMPAVKGLLNISREATSFTPWGLRKWFTHHGFTDVVVKPFEFGGKLNFLENIPVLRQFGGSILITGIK